MTLSEMQSNMQQCHNSMAHLEGTNGHTSGRCEAKHPILPSHKCRCWASCVGRCASHEWPNTPSLSAVKCASDRASCECAMRPRDKCTETKEEQRETIVGARQVWNGVEDTKYRREIALMTACRVYGVWASMWSQSHLRTVGITPTVFIILRPDDRVSRSTISATP